jgi:hypothetical protein
VLDLTLTLRRALILVLVEILAFLILPLASTQAAATVLLKIISNITLHPVEEKYRRLNRTNQAFSKKVGTVAGGVDCMIALGFHLEGDEFVLIPNAEAWDNIVACKNKLEKFVKRLDSQASSSRVSLPVAAPQG